jgi:uncharacterized RDD family membrane protein YckC
MVSTPSLAADTSLRHRVRTPENVEFQFILGNPGSRFMAWAFDNVLAAGIALVGLLILAAASGTGLGEVRGSFSSGLAGFLGLLIVFGAQWGYFVICEWWLGGQTPGKKLFHLRVVSEDGGRFTFQQSALRNLLRMVDTFPVAAVIEVEAPVLHLFPVFFLPGALSAFLSSRSQRLGDLVAGTLVVEEARRALPSTIVPPRERYNSFIEDPDIADRLHRRLSPTEAEVLVALCLRRDELELASRLRLFGRAATLLEARLGLQKPEIFSDEKFVLNLVAVLLGSDRTAQGAPGRGATDSGGSATASNVSARFRDRWGSPR